jgi:aspartate aminotransferase-like enzyme
MLPPGLSFNAIGAKALAATKTAKLPRSYWDWNEMLAINATGYFPYTPATNLLYGLHEALEMLFDEGLDAVFERQCATRGGNPARGSRLGTRNPVCGAFGVQSIVDRNHAARRAQCRRPAQSDPRSLRFVLSGRASAN